MKRLGLFLWLLGAQAHADPSTLLPSLKLPEGFNISIYAEHLPNARSMTLAENGVLFVGTGAEGKVYAVSPPKQGKTQVYTIAQDLTMPNGVAYRDGALYVAAINRILRFDAITEHLSNPPKPVVIYDQFPAEKHHGWKYLRFGPDGKLYTAVGAPCNICLPEKDIFTSLVRLNPDGTGLEILARGIRNTVGFDWHPTTKRLYFNDNGRDYLGDDKPPDELNSWSEVGEHFGYPYCHGGTIADPELADKHTCSEFKAPAWRYKAHIAPLGMRFYTGQTFPTQYQHRLFVAQHGSWNRSQPQGYKVVALKLDNAGNVITEQDFITGWLTENNQVLGRPVDILELPSGELLISDDKQGVIYSITYRSQAK